ncbi:hypothetical protein LEP1GSC062_1107 [Leptospira alexanderi serovar Manhao 3 str. L 60]|uniref:Uncharacterized protein n=1 Tax=Leptospira alexanderi serovar Manhao 3 str. L 60 TaxID=1049759 RepID=V6I0J5_9LEPT|nr:hypothetical protein LEP1GSC062_1107 [Leptospira alexanderi serovar Manhao 3 str. L 60]
MVRASILRVRIKKIETAIGKSGNQTDKSSDCNTTKPHAVKKFLIGETRMGLTHPYIIEYPKFYV